MIEQLAVMQAMRGILCLGPTSGLYSDIDESVWWSRELMNDAQLLLQTYVLIDVETVKVCFKMFSQGQKLDVIYE